MDYYQKEGTTKFIESKIENETYNSWWTTRNIMNLIESRFSEKVICDAYLPLFVTLLNILFWAWGENLWYDIMMDWIYFKEILLFICSSARKDSTIWISWQPMDSLIVPTQVLYLDFGQEYSWWNTIQDSENYTNPINFQYNWNYDSKNIWNDDWWEDDV